LNIYRRLAFISHPGHPAIEPGAGPAFFSEFIMIWEPENFKYLTDLTIFYQDIKHEEENYVFVPAFRRTLRVSTLARCSPLFGGDYTKDDARGGFNGNISIFQSQFLRDQKIIALSDLMGQTLMGAVVVARCMGDRCPAYSALRAGVLLRQANNVRRQAACQGLVGGPL
jgi:hypothetical protein